MATSINVTAEAPSSSNSMKSLTQGLSCVPSVVVLIYVAH
jgi:hypothetical protein